MDTFRCENNRCIQYSKVCDGNNDCNETTSISTDETTGCQGILIEVFVTIDIGILGNIALLCIT